MRNLGYMSGYMQKAGAPAEGMPGFIGPVSVWQQQIDDYEDEEQRPLNPQEILNFNRKMYNIPGFHKGYLEDPGNRIRGTYSGDVLYPNSDMKPEPYFPRSRSVETSPQDIKDYANNVAGYNENKKKYEGDELSIDERESLDEFNSKAHSDRGIEDPLEYSMRGDIPGLRAKYRAERAKEKLLGTMMGDAGARAAAREEYIQTVRDNHKEQRNTTHIKDRYTDRIKNLLNLDKGMPPKPKTSLDTTHDAPMKPGYAEDIQNSLPGFRVHQSSTASGLYNNPSAYNAPHRGKYRGGLWDDIQMGPEKADTKARSPYLEGFSVMNGYGGKKPNITIPKPGPDGLETALHEYTHAVDPALSGWFRSPNMEQDDVYSKRGRPQPKTREAEIPAMVTERAAEASPYLPPERRRHFTTPMGKQIEKFGPTLRGNFRGDLGNIENWMQALRRRPGAGIQAKKPFAYHGDTRTPQQRATALGSAYQGWMNSQPYKGLGAEFKPPKPLMSTTQKSYLPASIRAPDTPQPPINSK